MKFCAYECRRFLNLRLLLIGMLFLALEARAGEEYCTSKIWTFLAVNSSKGAQLVYKNSGSKNIEKITFEGLYLSSAMACGMNYRRCPNLTVLMDGNVVVIVIPLQEHFGLVSYDKNDGKYLTFREKYAVDISNLDLECEISSISQYSPSRLTVIGRCLYTKAYPKLLNSVYVVISAYSLAESDYFPEQFCNVILPSEFIFFKSATFLMGATVFVDNGQVKFQRYGEDCETFGEISVCTDVQRFTSVSPGLQAIYCNTTTYLIDIVSIPAIQTFKRDNDGLPFFCSKHAYYSYKDGKISFHQTISKTQRGTAVPIGFGLNNVDVIWGDCVNSMFVVIQSTDGKVISLTVETGKVNFFGFSQTNPRIFGTTMLLNNLTHALVYDLQTSKLDVIEHEFVMGYVIKTVDYCMTFDIAGQEESEKRPPGFIYTLGALISFFFLVTPGLIGIFCWVYIKKFKKSGSGVKTKRSEDDVGVNADNFPKLDQVDANMMSANGSGPPLCFTVDNSPELDSVIYQESVEGSSQLVSEILPEKFQ